MIFDASILPATKPVDLAKVLRNKPQSFAQSVEKKICYYFGFWVNMPDCSWTGAGKKNTKRNGERYNNTNWLRVMIKTPFEGYPLKGSFHNTHPGTPQTSLWHQCWSQTWWSTYEKCFWRVSLWNKISHFGSSQDGPWLTVSFIFTLKCSGGWTGNSPIASPLRMEWWLRNSASAL